MLYHKESNINSLLFSASSLAQIEFLVIFLEFLRAKTKRVFIGHNHHIKFNPPNPDSLNPIPRVYSRACMRVCVYVREHYTRRRKDCAREERPGEGRKKAGRSKKSLADAIDSQAGSRRDNAKDEGPPK